MEFIEVQVALAKQPEMGHTNIASLKTMFDPKFEWSKDYIFCVLKTKNNINMVWEKLG
jgi:hypothetical protein